MINLEPIPSKIQRRLKQKQNVLGRKTREFNIGEAQTSGDLPELSFDMLATRTPFIRMTSGLEEPVVLMGGELKRTPEEETDLTLPSGYDEIYGARRLINEGASNELRRPVPGLKSVSAEFLGGSKATRRATINWSCWSFEDIDRLTPHFLQHGHSVLVEWGWVYSKKQLENLVNFRNLTGFEGGTIKPDVYANYRDTIVNEFGDIDVMAGVISNYEYTTREDGGFDCQTIITSLGVNLFNRVEKNKEVSDNSVVIDLSKVFNDKERKIEFNTNTSFKAFLTYIDRYIATVFENEVLGKKLLNQKFSTNFNEKTPDLLYYSPNEYVIKYRRKDNSSQYGQATFSQVIYLIDDVWVRWGWFEDNILSQFTTLTNKDGQIVARFRSVEENLDDEENSTAKYQSTQIRNHKYLETIDFNSYILPGQFYPLKSREVEGLDKTIRGDGNDSIDIATIVNDKDNFKPFSTGIDSSNTKRAESFAQVESDTNGGGSHGFLRNMLINTSMIKAAFGVQTNKKDDTFKIEPMNINQGIQTLFKNINGVGGLSMWNFVIKQDETDDERLKIIDDSTTFIDFNSPEPLSNKKTKTFFKDDLNIDGEPGIFYFPVWQTDSIVKGQNISARIPSALQIATMYGANTGVTLKEPNNVASNHEPAGVIAGAVGSNNVDKRFVGSDIAIRNRHAIGPKDGEDENELNVQNKTKILDFLLTDKTIQDELTKSDNTMAKERDAKALSNVQLALHESVREKFKDDVKKPVPTIEYLSEDDLNFILSDKALPELFGLIDINKITKELNETGVEEQAALNKADDEILRGMKLAFEKVRNNFLRGLGSKYRGGVMKENFLNAMKDKITYTLTTANDNMPILIPLELELEIDGIGGIYPGNSFHSTYLPKRYQDKSVFQIVSVNHEVSEVGWKVTLIGKMRTSISKVLPTTKEEFSQEDVSINALKFKFLEDLINAAPESVKEENQKAADFVDDVTALTYYGTPIGQAAVIFNKIARKISRYFD